MFVGKVTSPKSFKFFDKSYQKLKILVVDDLPRDCSLKDEVRLERVQYVDDDLQKVAELTFTEQVL
jgi:hypothetical protein